MFQDELHGLGAAGLGAARQALQALCQELNLDEGSAAEALGDFMAIRSTYSLEGEVVHWLACALYVACRKSIIPTVGKGIMEGNCVSLTRILRSAKLSLIQFFSKMKKWIDMSNLPQEFRERIERLERNFEVSTVIFKKFEPIFLDIFRNPYEEPPKLPRSRKQRRVPCTVKDLFNFCWTLFVYTKGNFRMIGDDLVNSYHLLLCCLDLTFTNAIMCPNRRDLLNLSFKGLPPDFHTSDYRASEEPPCIIAALCELHDGLLVEAKGIKEHYFKPYISKLFDRKILKGECLLDISSFADNSKAVNKEYEEYVLTVGDFDERVFLGADAEEEIGSPQKFIGDTPAGKLITRVQVECNLQQHFAKERSFAPSTPLTGRRYLQEKEAATTPVASATQSVSRLQNIVAGLKNAPSEQLVNIFESCVRNPMENIMNIVKSIGEAFCQHYTQSTDEQPGSHIDFAVNRLKLAEILYYKILETVMVQETRRHHGMDMSVLLEQDIFHRSLMACCLEIVLFAYSSPRSFPWIIEVLDLSPFYFYKVIEVLIRSEEGLSRDTIKHLNSIEEQILESLAWSNDSALWDALHISENKVPTCEEVIFPNNLEMGNVQGHLPMMPLSPIVHPRVKEVRTDSGNLRRDVQPLSPISVHERYSSPTAGSAKRRLFGEDTSSKMFVDKTATEGTKLKIASSSSVIAENVSVLPGQSLLTVAPAVVAGTTGQRVTIPLHGVAIDTGGITVIPMPVNASEQSRVESPVQIPITAQSLSGTSPKQSHGTKALEMHQAGVSRPKRTGSLALFYRKVYHLASVRLRDLCLKLDISNDLRRKIWTCFEFTLVHCFDLMKDRHLDQLLLCAFYIMAKVTKEERTFQDIMKSYRNQPQANSHVYRSVLLKRIPREVSTCNKNVKDTEMADYDLDCAKIPDCSTGAMKEERGDLIKFYNEVYIGRVKSFALKYDLSNEDHVMEAPPLSPFPNIKQQPVSPRRISQQHSVYVSPHQNGTCLTPRTALLYRFNGSPSKSLKDINNMIKYGEQRSKKRALTIDGDTQSPTKRLCQENDDVLLKRLQDVVSERANH
ncbi:retinoblastoma-like protein 1 isoform X1 [Phascolarctos cinereus]|uniref:Retinoblastoma-like protein 1 n=1 Tax=Phascolarctos cinereus TaxID=38626 RepID=A0A6P5KLD4_PHACI|nr:retinoblastoma-like protein 1 isoform X1 [Phascolarctos cinereus]XP_020846459.1 retinoblastoma-like protein 1 isoform X1 [Phascolarctos cinereus]